MIDKNRVLKRKLIFALIAIIVVMPFYFVYLKHQGEIQNLAKSQKSEQKIPQVATGSQSRPAPQIQPQPQPAPKPAPAPRKNSDKEIFIYKSDLAGNIIDVFADARKLKLSHDGKRLFSYGINRDGFMIIDVSNPKKLVPIGVYKYPKARYHVSDINIAESKDGKSLYVADPHNGILHFDISNPHNIKLVSSLGLEVPTQIKLSHDDKIAYVKTTKGFFTIDISGAQMKKLGEFASDTGESENDLFGIRPRGDFDFLSKNEILFINFNDMYIFDVSNPKNIKAKYHSYDFNIFKGGKLQMMFDFKIAKNNTRLYAATGNGFRIYDISDIKNIKLISEYISSGYLTSRNMQIDEKENLACLGKSTKTDEGKFARIEVVDLSYELDPMPIKSYNMPENHNLLAVLSKDKKYLFIQAEPGGYGDFVSAYEK